MNWNDMAILGIFAILVIGLTVLKPVFLTPDNLINVIRQVSITAIIGIGMTFVLISGEIDLSVGSIAALAGIVVTMSLKDGMPMVIAIVLAMGVGALCGWHPRVCENSFVYRDNGYAQYCQRRCAGYHKFLSRDRTAGFF